MATVAPAPDIRALLDDLVSSILAMPRGLALQNLSVLDAAFTAGRVAERQAMLGIAPRPQPSRHLSLVPSARPS